MAAIDVAKMDSTQIKFVLKNHELFTADEVKAAAKIEVENIRHAKAVNRYFRRRLDVQRHPVRPELFYQVVQE